MLRKFSLLSVIVIALSSHAQNSNWESSLILERRNKEEWHDIILDINEQFRAMSTERALAACKIVIIQQVTESKYEGNIPSVPLACIGKYKSKNFKFKQWQLSEVSNVRCKIKIDGLTKDNRIGSSFYIQTENKNLKRYLDQQTQILGLDTSSSNSFYISKISGSEEEFCSHLSQIIAEIDYFIENERFKAPEKPEKNNSFSAQFSFLNATNTSFEFESSNSLINSNIANDISLGYSIQLYAKKKLKVFNSIGGYYRNQSMKLNFQANNELVGYLEGLANLPVYCTYSYTADINHSYFGLFNETCLKYKLFSDADFFVRPSISVISGFVDYSSSIIESANTDLYVFDNYSGILFRDIDLLAPFAPKQVTGNNDNNSSFLDVFIGLSIGYESKWGGVYLGYKMQKQPFEKSSATANISNPDFSGILSEYRKSAPSLMGLFLSLNYNY